MGTNGEIYLFFMGSSGGRSSSTVSSCDYICMNLLVHVARATPLPYQFSTIMSKTLYHPTTPVSVGDKIVWYQ